MNLIDHLLNGGTGNRPDPIPLKAGPLTALFHPDSGVLRYVRLGDHEIVRAIYGAVRDRHWNTVPTHLENTSVQSHPDAFQISFHAFCRAEGIEFRWIGSLTGDAEGRVTYQFEGEPALPFLRNRIGLCVLHPVTECAGKPCDVEAPDGSVSQTKFPDVVAPHPPFRNLRALRHEPAPGVNVELRFEGDLFETEDQRNWSDASFKTFSTPSDQPAPVEVRPGTVIRQSVSLSFPGPVRKILPILLGRPPQFSIATTPILLRPALGVCGASHDQPLDDLSLQRLKALQLTHLRTDVRFQQAGWQARWERDCREAARLGSGLHVALHLGNDAPEALAALTAEFARLQPKVLLWLVYHRDHAATPVQTLRQAKAALAGCAANALFASGTNAHFAELNRNRAAAEGTALPCYGLTPQVHASDDATLVENIGAQPLTVEGTRSFAPRAVVLSPITLRPRFNANFPQPEPPLPLGTQPSHVDPRQMSLLGAGWTLGSIARLAAGGNLHSLTYFETTGQLGIMAGTASPTDSWPAPAGSVYPVYHVLADMAGYTRLCPTLSSHPLQTEAMTLLDAKSQRRILVANLTSQELDLRIKSGTCKAVVHVLDKDNVEQAVMEPETFRARPGVEIAAAGGKLALPLGPYALARVDVIS